MIDFIEIIAWPFVVLCVYLHLSKPLKNLVSAVAQVMHSIDQKGVKLTSHGIVIPSRQEAENIVADIKAPSYLSTTSLLNKPEKVIGENLEKKSSNVKDILEKHEQRMVEEVLQAIDSFLTTKTSISKNSEPTNAGKSSSGKASNEEKLKGLLCDAYIYLYFERTFKKILNSQFELLQKLYNTNSNSLENKEIEEFFYTQEESKSIELVQWMNFLEKSRLTYTKDNKLYLSNEGKEFIKYITRRDYKI